MQCKGFKYFLKQFFKPFFKHWVWIAVSLFQIQTGVLAQSSEEEELALVYGDKSTVSIATGSQQLLRRAPAVTTVITAGDIATMGARDLDEVLETVPGLHVNRSANVYSPLYVIRGIVSQYTPQTLVLQNGIPITTMYIGNKGNAWGGYPLEHVARIEIIRGPGSALYGADAYSGVINIITKNAADASGTEVGVNAGSFHTWDTWVHHAGKLGAMDVAAYLRAGSTEGFKEIVTADAQTRSDRAFGTSASLAPGRVYTGGEAIDGNLDLSYRKWRFRTGYKLRDDLGTGAGVAQALDSIGKVRSERITADLSWTSSQITQDLSAGFSGSYLYYSQELFNLTLFPPGATFPTGSFPMGMIGNPNTWERQFRFSAYAIYSGFAKHRVRVGAGHDDLNLYRTEEWKNFTFTPSGVPVPLGAVMDFSTTMPFMFPQRRKVNYAYVQDEWNIAKDWTLTAGIRHDKYSDFGNTMNPRLALVWDAAHDFTAKLLYGHAFRAPAFSEEYSINNPVARGNPGLRPETIKTMEAVFSWQSRKNTQLNLNLFRYEMEDIIRTVPNAIPGTGATYNNTGNQTGHGLETEVIWDATRDLRVFGSYAYQHSIDGRTNQDAGYAPAHQIYARADWRVVSGWLASSQINWVADRKRTAGDNRPPVPDYTTVDVSVRSDRGKYQWDFAATVRNVFNADVREPSLAPGVIPNDLPMPGRAFYVQAIFKM